MSKKKNILFIQDENSLFDIKSKMFDRLFESTEKIMGEQKALKLIYNNNYDIIINDISVNPLDGISFMKQIKQMRPSQEIVTLVAPTDEDKLGDLIESGIHAFVLIPEQFEQALEAISQMHS